MYIYIAIWMYIYIAIWICIYIYIHTYMYMYIARAQSGGGVLSMAKGTALFDAVAISSVLGASVRKGAGRRCEPCRCLRGRVWADGVRGRFAAGVAAPAVRSVAAWCAWTMGPSRSRAERSQTPGRGCAFTRCVRTSQMLVLWRCTLRTMLHATRCGYGALSRGYVVCKPLPCCNVVYVARCVMWHAGVVHCAVQPLCGTGRRMVVACCMLYVIGCLPHVWSVNDCLFARCALYVVCSMPHVWCVYNHFFASIE
jgi:hypothetical protein